MDTTQYAEGQYLNTEMVKASPSKRLYILGDVKVAQGKFGEKLELPVEIDQKQKTWSLNKDHVKSLQQFGKDSKTWIGKWVQVAVTSNNGKETIIAMPVIVPEERVQ